MLTIDQVPTLSTITKFYLAADLAMRTLPSLKPLTHNYGYAEEYINTAKLLGRLIESLDHEIGEQSVDDKLQDMGANPDAYRGYQRDHKAYRETLGLTSAQNASKLA